VGDVARTDQRTTSDEPTSAPTLASATGWTLTQEVLIVLSLSLLPSAIDALLSYFQAPVNPGVSVGLFPSFPSFPFLRELLAIAFALPPVWLVFHLAGRTGEGLKPFGLGTSTLAADIGWGSAGAVIVASFGLGVYLSAIALNVNRFVVPVPPLGNWWTVPILLLGALQNALLEEVVVLAYLIRRLEQLRWPTVAAVATSAVFRGSYHLY
jgi:membrane protease YdiL (CAAX protease family)